MTSEVATLPIPALVGIFMCSDTIAQTLGAGFINTELTSAINMARIVATRASWIIFVGTGANVAMLIAYHIRNKRRIDVRNCSFRIG